MGDAAQPGHAKEEGQPTGASAAPMREGAAQAGLRRKGVRVIQPATHLWANTSVEVYTSLTEEEKDRYGDFLRGTVCSLATLEKVFNQIVGQKALSKENMKKVTTIMEAASKLFAGELVERARIVASEMGYEGPLLPEHLRQAHHELVGEGKIPCRDLKRRRMFR